MIDHILFSQICGRSLSHRIVVRTINRLIELVACSEDVEAMAICGNPTQLGLYTNGELQDLIYSLDALMRKGILVPNREAKVLDSRTLGINADCDVLVAPSIKAEVGADAVAMIIKSGIMNESSAAAGPAIEGQHISRDMLAAPGALLTLHNLNEI